MASFEDLLDNPETLEEKQTRWFNKLRGWVPQCIWFENLQSQELSELITDTIEQPLFGDVRDISSTSPVNEYSLTSDTTENVGTGDIKDLLGNTFTPAATFEADSVGMDLRNINSISGHVNIEIYATAAGLPTGGAIGSTNDILVGDLPTSHGTVTMLPLTAPLTLTGSVQYAVVVNQMNVDGDISAALDSSDVLAGGTYVASEDNGTSWALDSGKDVVFQVSGFAAGATLTGRAAQQFRADNLGQLKDLSLALHTDVAASTGTVRFEVLDDDGGSPGIIVHGFLDIDVTTLPIDPTGIFVGYSFTPVQNLAGNKDYWLVARNTVIPDAKVFSETKTGGGFPQEHKVSFDSGATWSADLPAVDLSFKIFTERIADADVDGINVAVFQSLAIVAATVECAIINHVRETYICRAQGAYLDEHGLERTVQRTLNELDNTYRERIKNITNSTSCPQIKTLVDALLPVGEATILEDFDAGLFFDEKSFLTVVKL